jgi:hypothetical protein
VAARVLRGNVTQAASAGARSACFDETRQLALTVSGSASGEVVLLHFVNVTPGHGGSADLTGTVSGNTMGGTFHTNESGTGT